MFVQRSEFNLLLLLNMLCTSEAFILRWPHAVDGRLKFKALELLFFLKCRVFWLFQKDVRIQSSETSVCFRKIQNFNIFLKQKTRLWNFFSQVPGLLFVPEILQQPGWQSQDCVPGEKPRQTICRHWILGLQLPSPPVLSGYPPLLLPPALWHGSVVPYLWSSAVW